MKPVVVVHGGAGRVPEEDEEERWEGCRRAALAGWRRLLQGGSALDAVEEAVAFLEDHPLFNAGRGSVLNAVGEVEMDASLMDGGRLNAGGEGADRFARDIGISGCSGEELITERQRMRWEAMTDSPGTVGAVAVDGDGGIAAATSTGGLLRKRPGRVGDSALIGAGTYADHLLGAASVTGHGEAIMGVVLSRTAVDLLAEARHPQEAARLAMAVLGERGQGEGGIILVDHRGRVGHAHNAPLMSCAFMDESAGVPGLLR